MENKLIAPHTGNLLRSYFSEKRIHKAALARLLNKNYKSLLDLEKRSNIQTSILWALSHALKKNFFEDIARQLPESYASPSLLEKSQAQKIVELERENEILTNQLNMLKEVIQKKLT